MNENWMSKFKPSQSLNAREFHFQRVLILGIPAMRSDFRWKQVQILDEKVAWALSEIWTWILA